uniref:Pecanex-like protein n=1 Tax=Heterorhabditis bacteriophora TaxID=37862 RepID=A0A1I7WS19_HETBA
MYAMIQVLSHRYHFRLYGFKIHPLAYNLQYQQSPQQAAPTNNQQNEKSSQQFANAYGLGVMKSNSASRPSSLNCNVTRQDPLEFQVVPEMGLKNENVEFILGMPLNQVREKIFSEPGAEASMDKVDEFFGSTHPGGGNNTSRSVGDGDLELIELNKTIAFGDSVARRSFIMFITHRLITSLLKTVMSALGAPSKVFYKSEDKMSIHRGANKETLNPLPHFFFNYFSMGLVSLSVNLSFLAHI